MSTANPIAFLLNTSAQSKQEQAVIAPAFSLTKVLASGAIIIGPLATYLVDKISNINFSAGQVTALGIGLLGFLALTASADVLARSIGTVATERTKTAQATQGDLIRFDSPMNGHHANGSTNPAVKIIGYIPSASPTYLVVNDAGTTEWLPQKEIIVG